MQIISRAFKRCHLLKKINQDVLKLRLFANLSSVLKIYDFTITETAQQSINLTH